MSAISPTSDGQFSVLWDAACQQYAKAAAISPLDRHFPRPETPAKLRLLLEDEQAHFDDFRQNKRQFFHILQKVLAPLDTFGDLLGSISAASFPPASVIMGAILLLVRAGKNVSGSFEGITNLFEHISLFAERLEEYKTLQLRKGLQEVVVKFIVALLQICGLCRKIARSGRFKAWLKDVFTNDSEVKDALSNLEEMTKQEHLMVAVQTLGEVHESRRQGIATHKEVQNLRSDLRVDANISRSKRLRDSLSPIDASETIFSSILNSRMRGSCEWLDHETCYISWLQRQRASGTAPFAGTAPPGSATSSLSLGLGSMLWVRGSMGAGKSYIASKMITSLKEHCRRESDQSSSVSCAYFFCKDNDNCLQSLNNALRTMAWQIVGQDPTFAATADRVCPRINVSDSRQLWEELFLSHFLSSENRSKAYLIIDALDEARPNQRDEFLTLLEETFVGVQTSHLPRFRIAFVSRENQRRALEDHALDMIPSVVISAETSTPDIKRFITHRVDKVRALKKMVSFRDELISELCSKSDGLWLWADLALRTVLQCDTIAAMRRALAGLPKGLPKMLQHELERLSVELASSEDLMQQLNILLACVTVARQPFTIRQLRYILQRSVEEVIIGFDDHLTTTFSSMFAVRPRESTSFKVQKLSGSTPVQLPRPSRTQPDIITAGDMEQREPTEVEADVNISARGSWGRGIDEDSFGDSDQTSTYSNEYLVSHNEDDSDQADAIVDLRHASLYEFFRSTAQTTPVGVDINKAEIMVLKTLLSDMCDDDGIEPGRTGYQRRSCLRSYQDDFLGAHFWSADPNTADKVTRQVISDHFHKLFTDQDTIRSWAFAGGIVGMPWGGIPFNTSIVSEVLSYWLPAWYRDFAEDFAEGAAEDAADDLKKAIGERRASKILLWDENGQNFSRNQDLAEEQVFQESEKAIKTVFGRLVSCLGSLWLAPERLEDDGSAEALSQIILSYNELSGTLDNIPDSRDRIMFCAESLQQPRTGIWHARVAQALSCHFQYTAAISEFESALDKSVEGSWIVNAGLAHAYSHLHRYHLAVECLEASVAQRTSTNSVHSGVAPEMHLATEMISKAHWLDQQGLTRLALRAAIEACNVCDGQSMHLTGVCDFCLGFFTKHRRENELLSLVKYLQIGLVGSPMSWYFAARFNANHESFTASICRSFDRDVSRLTRASSSRLVVDTSFYAALFYSEHGRRSQAVQLWEKLLGVEFDNVTIANGWFSSWCYMRKIAWRELGLHHFSLASNKSLAASEARGNIKSLEKVAPILAISEDFQHDVALDEMVQFSLVQSNIYRVNGEAEESRKCLRAQVAQNLRLIDQSRGRPVEHSMKLLAHFAIRVHALFKLLQVFLFARCEYDRSLIATLFLLKVGSIGLYHTAGADLDSPFSLISRKLATDHKIMTSRVKLGNSASNVPIAKEQHLRGQDLDDGHRSDADGISMTTLASETCLDSASGSEGHDHSHVANDKTGLIHRARTPHSHLTVSPYTLDTYGIIWHWDQDKVCVCFKQPSVESRMRTLRYHTRMLFERDLQRVVNTFAPCGWRHSKDPMQAKPAGYCLEYPSSGRKIVASKSQNTSSECVLSIPPIRLGGQTGLGGFHSEQANTTCDSAAETQGHEYECCGNNPEAADSLIESTQRLSRSNDQNNEAAPQRAASHGTTDRSGKAQDKGEAGEARSEKNAASHNFESELPTQLQNPADRQNQSCPRHEYPGPEERSDPDNLDSETIHILNEDVYLTYETLQNDDIYNMTHDDEYPFGFRCVGCTIRKNSYSNWHLCRICPYTALCRKCFGRLQSDTLVRTVCGKEHEFFDTGSPLVQNEVSIATHIADQTVPYGDEWVPLSEWVEKVRLEWNLTVEEVASGCLQEAETF